MAQGNQLFYHVLGSTSASKLTQHVELNNQIQFTNACIQSGLLDLHPSSWTGSESNTYTLLGHCGPQRKALFHPAIHTVLSVSTWFSSDYLHTIHVKWKISMTDMLKCIAKSPQVLFEDRLRMRCVNTSVKGQVKQHWARRASRACLTCKIKANGAVECPWGESTENWNHNPMVTESRH